MSNVTDCVVDVCVAVNCDQKMGNCGMCASDAGPNNVAPVLPYETFDDNGTDKVTSYATHHCMCKRDDNVVTCVCMHATALLL